VKEREYIMKLMSHYYGSGDFSDREANIHMDIYLNETSLEYKRYYMLELITDNKSVWRKAKLSGINYAEDAADNWVMGIDN
tara:strand:+ start:649 stop:891 length:243 start_codon:yes stop_codon:yes gene_type:complete